jgi:hypothetical protein
VNPARREAASSGYRKWLSHAAQLQPTATDLQPIRKGDSNLCYT